MHLPPERVLTIASLPPASGHAFQIQSLRVVSQCFQPDLRPSLQHLILAFSFRSPLRVCHLNPSLTTPTESKHPAHRELTKHVNPANLVNLVKIRVSFVSITTGIHHFDPTSIFRTKNFQNKVQTSRAFFQKNHPVAKSPALQAHFNSKPRTAKHAAPSHISYQFKIKKICFYI